jgi:hypothetical protein
MGEIVVGDVHNLFGHLNTLINRKRPELLIACGDFGFWPNERGVNELSVIKPKDTKILWCDGNHENHWALRDRTTDEMEPGVIYMPRGSTYTLPDGRNVLFMGGAHSIDKHLRKLGIDWFPEETITQSDIMNLPDMNIDIFITHTCPGELVPKIITPYNARDFEPSNLALTRLWEIYRPKLWYIGHWHKYLEVNMYDTQFYFLAHAGWGGRWWRWLD